jgi:hypothetical protein
MGYNSTQGYSSGVGYGYFSGYKSSAGFSPIANGAAFAGVQIGQAVLKGGSVWYNSENDPVFDLLPHSTAFSGVTYPLLAVKYPSLVTPVMPDETGSPHPYQIVADYTGA